MSVGADIEMVRPALGDDGVYGVEGTGVPGKWGWRVGLSGGYENQPVLVLTEGEITSRPVTDRIGGWAGFSLGFGRRVAVQAVVPLAWQTGNDDTLSANGAGLGDPRIGARWGLLDTSLVNATLRADLYVPIGKQDAWMGESSARASFGASGSLEGGFGAILLDVGLLARPLETPRPGLDWGPTAEFGAGVRVDVHPKVSVGASWIGRAVLAGLEEQDGELASEVLASARWKAADTVGLTAGGGFGTQAGVGVPTFRGFVGAVFSEPPKKPKVEKPVAEVKPPPTREKLLEEEIPGLDVPPPPPPPMVKVEGDEITFREEIGFTVGSADLLPESRVVLAAVADLLASDGRIAHVAIEGHTSKEGDLAFNWDLSDRRARAVWEALVVEGVSPQRMSWRGLGEVMPRAGTGSNDVVAEDRRVVLRIARRLAKDEALPVNAATTPLPWNGEAVALDVVSIPAAPVAPKTEFVDPSFFDNDEEEE